MEIEKRIEIWKQKENFNTPLANPVNYHGSNETATTTVGDYVLIMDNAVWVQHCPQGFATFRRAVYSVEFFKANTHLFERKV